MTGALLIIIASVLTAISQYLFKRASTAFDLKHPVAIVTNPGIAAGLLLYLASFVFTIAAYRHGDMVILFPLMNLSLIWSLLLSKWLLKESITPSKLAGTAVILLGCALLFV